jgi:hypothetical protein
MVWHTLNDVWFFLQKLEVTLHGCVPDKGKKMPHIVKLALKGNVYHIVPEFGDFTDIVEYLIEVFFMYPV